MLSPIILSAFDEKMSFNSPLAWDLVLSFVKGKSLYLFPLALSRQLNRCGVVWRDVAFAAYPECWSHVNAHKSVFPRLFAAIQSGGYGSPRVMYPYLMPLLTCIPQHVIAAATASAADAAVDSQRLTEFYDKYLNAIWGGLRVTKRTALNALHTAHGFDLCLCECAASSSVMSTAVASDSKLVLDTYFECVLVIVAATK